METRNWKLEIRNSPAAQRFSTLELPISNFQFPVSIFGTSLNPNSCLLPLPYQ